MDIPIKNKKPAPVVINRQDRWPFPANRLLSSVQPDLLEEPSNINAGENKASNVPQEFKASPSLPQKPGRGIGRFAGSHSLIFQPGSQNYPNRELATSVQHQNTNLRSFLLNTVSDFESSTQNSALTTTTTSGGVFKQWQSEEHRIDDSVEENNMEDTNIQNSSDSDSDGGVTLAMQAAFLQQPGITGLSLRPVAPKSNKEPQKQVEKTQEFSPGEQKLLFREHELGQQETGIQKIVKKPSLRPQPSLSSHMAAILQTPGSVKFVSTRRRSSVTTTTPSPNCSSSTSPFTSTPVGLEKEDKIIEPFKRQPTPDGTPYTLPNSISISKKSIEDKSPGRFTDPDNDLYWSTPIIQPVRPSKPPQEPISKSLQNSPQQPLHKPFVPVPITKQKDYSPSSLITPRRFRELEDGDIVGEEAPVISKENKGRRMMEKMGYKEGTPLGTSGDGKLEPVKVEIRVGNRGLGLSKEDLASRAREEQAIRLERAREEQAIRLQRAREEQAIRLQRAREEQAIRHERARNIEQELLARAAQTEKIARIHRASLDAAFPQYQTNQIILGTFDPTGTNQAFTTQSQLEGLVFPAPVQIVKYTAVTPWEIHKIRERVTQILCDLDVSGSLGPIDSASTLWSCIKRAIADIQNSRFGFLVDAELTEIVRREYLGVIIRREQAGGWVIK